MRIRSSILSFAMLAVGMSASASAQVNGQLVPVIGDDLFVPSGFDDNDEAVLVVDGYLPNSCYRIARPEVALDQSTGMITVTPMARYFDLPCLEALVPYNFEVRLGVLPMGEFEVSISGTDVKAGLEVTEASNAGPDDYLYLPVDDVSVNVDSDGQLKATLTGRFTNSCMTFDSARVIHTGKTVQLLPVMDFLESDACLTGIFPYSEKVVLPASLEKARHLLHVRSLNGRDVNRLFTVTD